MLLSGRGRVEQPRCLSLVRAPVKAPAENQDWSFHALRMDLSERKVLVLVLSNAEQKASPLWGCQDDTATVSRQAHGPPGRQTWRALTRSELDKPA